MTAQTQERTCEVRGCADPARPRGTACKRHYDRQRHRHRERSGDKLVAQRARNRATAALIENHRPEFAALLAVAVEQCQREATVIGPAKLRPGPKPADQTLTERVRLDVAKCAQCHRFHDSGHRCLNCSTPRPRSVAPRVGGEQSRRFAVEQMHLDGKTDQQIAGATGEPLSFVRQTVARVYGRRP